MNFYLIDRLRQIIMEFIKLNTVYRQIFESQNSNYKITIEFKISRSLFIKIYKKNINIQKVLNQIKQKTVLILNRKLMTFVNSIPDIFPQIVSEIDKGAKKHKTRSNQQLSIVVLDHNDLIIDEDMSSYIVE